MLRPRNGARCRPSSPAYRPGQATSWPSTRPVAAATAIPWSDRPNRWLEDVLDDHCTVAHAYEAYGVVIGADMTLDAAATAQRRADLASAAAE